MVIAELILYFSVLLLYFNFKRVKKLFGFDQRVIRLKEQHHSHDTFSSSVMAKPKWLLKAHYGLLIFLFIFLFLALTVLITWLLAALQKALVFTDANAIYLGGSWGITAIPVLFMSLCLSNLILESCPFRSARYAADRYYRAASMPHKQDIKLTKLLFVIFFAIGFPFVILNTDNYSYVKEDGVYVHPFFSLSEAKYNIPEDIESVEVTYDRDRDGYDFYYTIRFTSGKQVELLNENRFESNKVVRLDSILASSHVKIERASFTREQWNRYIADDYAEDIVKSLEQLYLIE